MWVLVSVGELTHWCRRWEGHEVQTHPQKFWFGENPGKMWGNLGKVCVNLGKKWCMCVDFTKMATKMKVKTFFWKSCGNLVVFGQVRRNVGKLGWNLGKNGAWSVLILFQNSSHLQKSACYYTYELMQCFSTPSPRTQFESVESSG